MKQYLLSVYSPEIEEGGSPPDNIDEIMRDVDALNDELRRPPPRCRVPLQPERSTEPRPGVMSCRGLPEDFGVWPRGPASGPVMNHLQPRPLEIRVLAQGGIVRAQVVGEIDMQTAPMLEEALFREVDLGSEVLLDLTKVSFIDSCGLRVIIAAAQRAKSSGGALALGSPLPRQARRVIEIAGLEELLQAG